MRVIMASLCLGLLLAGTALADSKSGTYQSDKYMLTNVNMNIPVAELPVLGPSAVKPWRLVVNLTDQDMKRFRGEKEFVRETRYMSRQGWIRWQVFQNEKGWISHNDAAVVSFIVNQE